MPSIDIYSTSRCPLGVRCEACGIESADLAVHVVDFGTRLGVACLTLCAPCGTSGVLPNVAVATAVRLVGQHCGHLSITLDEMGELLREQDDR